MKTLLWERMLDADLNQRYFTQLAREYREQDIALKIIIAICSSVAVASWNIWTEPGFEWIWKFLTCLTTVLAVISPILNLSDKYQKSFNISVQLIDVLSQYETLWAKSKKMDDEAINEQMQILNQASLKISADAFNLNVTDKRKINLVHQSVIKARGLTDE